PPVVSTETGRRILLYGASGLAIFLVGFLIAVFFISPAPVFTEGTPVPRVLGLERAEAEDNLSDAGFRARFSESMSDPERSAGRIVWQDPAPGTVLPGGSTVRLTPSSGPSLVALPDLVGMAATEAKRILATLGLQGVAEDSVASSMDRGVIVATRPGAGSARAPGSRIEMVVSLGRRQAEVPDLTGLSLGEARRRLADAGFRVGNVRSGTVSQSEAMVIQQFPSAGAPATGDGRVDLVLDRVLTP
ncbi:MAG: PASTA domain-containing protein, partial [Gemmatimonadales bacterium]